MNQTGTRSPLLEQFPELGYCRRMPAVQLFQQAKQEIILVTGGDSYSELVFKIALELHRRLAHILSRQNRFSILPYPVADMA